MWHEKTSEMTFEFAASPLLFLSLRVEQHRPSSQTSFHPSFRNDIPGPVVDSLRVHALQLLIALNNTVEAPQLVAQTFTLLGEDVGLPESRVASWTRRTAAGGEVEPRQRWIWASVLFTDTPLL